MAQIRGLRLGLILGLILAAGILPCTALARTVVALGDSTTAGTPGFRSPAEMPPSGKGNEKSQYAYWMMKDRPDWQVINRGIAGERSDEILKRFEADVLSFKPQSVIVLAGVNDLFQGVPPQVVKANLSQIYKKARDAGIEVIACTILPYNSSTFQAQAGMYEVNEWIKEAAQRQGLVFVDLYGVLEDPDQSGHLRWTSDGLHPDVQGYRTMAEVILEAMEGAGNPTTSHIRQ